MVLALTAVAVATAMTAAGGAPAVRHAQRGWCEARSSVAWRRVLSRHIVARSRTTSLVPLALAHDGRSFFAGAYLARFSGVARIDTRTGRLTRVKAFPDPQLDQAWAALDGRWLVWNEYHGFDNFNDFTTWAWDTQARKLKQLGSAARGPTGQFWESPWRGPDIRHGMATWVQGVGPDQLGDIHTFNLRTGRDLVVRHGHPGGAFLLDHHIVVWAEASAPGVPTRMHAASALTGAPLPLPPTLRSLRNITGLETDGRRIAYPNASYKSLWWSPSPGAQPSEVIETRHLQHVDNSVQVSGRYVAFGIYPGVFVADTRLRRYVRVSTHGGSALIDSTDLLVTYGPTKKALHPLLRMSFLPLHDLPPMPACS
jgi:hypothetical protein